MCCPLGITIAMSPLYTNGPGTIGGQVLVPAAAVIPAPIVYIKVVAVKRLVVELQRTVSSLLRGSGPTGIGDSVVSEQACMAVPMSAL